MSHFSPPKTYQKIFYWIGRNSYRAAFELFWRLRIEGAENIPRKGAVLVASNHLSLVDPPLIGGCAPRPLYFFAKEELFRYPGFGWLIRQVNAFPVKRFEHDIGAFKRAQLLLENGCAVLVFPEGRRSKTGELGSAKAGVGMLACKTGAPVVPALIENTNRLSSLARVTVRFGRPILPDPARKDKGRYQEFADGVLAAIANLGGKMYNTKLK